MNGAAVPVDFDWQAVVPGYTTVGGPLPTVAVDPALRDERPSMGMTLRRVK